MCTRSRTQLRIGSTRLLPQPPSLVNHGMMQEKDRIIRGGHGRKVTTRTAHLIVNRSMRSTLNGSVKGIIISTTANQRRHTFRRIQDLPIAAALETSAAVWALDGHPAGSQPSSYAVVVCGIAVASEMVGGKHVASSWILAV